nr:hypothetical protein [uncultured Rhodopila sp.]
MRDLTGRGTAAMPFPPKGIAFEIADLVLVQSWAACTATRVAIRLDHGAEDEEYEEVIELHTASSSASRLIMWRNPTGVFVQPLLGRKQCFACVADALDSLHPKQRAELSDILAPAWPVH